VDFLTWTYFFRRLVQNPAFYGLRDSTPQGVADFLRRLVDTVLEDLEEDGCVLLGDDAADALGIATPEQAADAMDDESEDEDEEEYARSAAMSGAAGEGGMVLPGTSKAGDLGSRRGKVLDDLSLDELARARQVLGNSATMLDMSDWAAEQRREERARAREARRSTQGKSKGKGKGKGGEASASGGGGSSSRAPTRMEMMRPTAASRAWAVRSARRAAREERQKQARQEAVAPSTLGLIASFYYLRHQTVGTFNRRLDEATDDELSSFPWLVQLLADAGEFSELPVRHNEDQLNEELSRRLPWRVDSDERDFGDAHTKAFLLLQAHMCRLPPPISDYANDTKTVLDQTARVLNALMDMSADKGLLSACLGLAEVSQALVQARMPASGAADCV